MNPRSRERGYPSNGRRPVERTMDWVDDEQC